MPAVLGGLPPVFNFLQLINAHDPRFSSTSNGCLCRPFLRGDPPNHTLWVGPPHPPSMHCGLPGDRSPCIQAEWVINDRNFAEILNLPGETACPPPHPKARQKGVTGMFLLIMFASPNEQDGRNGLLFAKLMFLIISGKSALSCAFDI